MADLMAGVFYIVTGLLGATIGALFAALPKELLLAIAGFALLGTIGNSLAVALTPEGQREPAVITFLVSASGVTLFGVGSAFWGLVAGAMALLILPDENRTLPKRPEGRSSACMRAARSVRCLRRQTNIPHGHGEILRLYGATYNIYNTYINHIRSVLWEL